jgi:hypothetical protein
MRILSASACSTTRMVAVLCSYDSDDGQSLIEPVVAIESTVASLNDGDEVHHEPIILLDGCLSTVKDHCRFLDLVAELVVCPWPASEDAERLAPVLVRVKGRSVVEARIRNEKACAAARRPSLCLPGKTILVTLTTKP